VRLVDLLHERTLPDEVIRTRRALHLLYEAALQAARASDEVCGEEKRQPRVQLGRSSPRLSCGDLEANRNG
jgi:hypothetical protein